MYDILSELFAEDPNGQEVAIIILIPVLVRLHIIKGGLPSVDIL